MPSSASPSRKRRSKKNEGGNGETTNVIPDTERSSEVTSEKDGAKEKKRELRVNNRIGVLKYVAESKCAKNVKKVSFQDASSDGCLADGDDTSKAGVRRIRQRAARRAKGAYRRRREAVANDANLSSADDESDNNDQKERNENLSSKKNANTSETNNNNNKQSTSTKTARKKSTPEKHFDENNEQAEGSIVAGRSSSPGKNNKFRIVGLDETQGQTKVTLRKNLPQPKKAGRKREALTPPIRNKKRKSREVSDSASDGEDKKKKARCSRSIKNRKKQNKKGLVEMDSDRSEAVSEDDNKKAKKKKAKKRSSPKERVKKVRKANKLSLANLYGDTGGRAFPCIPPGSLFTTRYGAVEVVSDSRAPEDHNATIVNDALKVEGVIWKRERVRMQARRSAYVIHHYQLIEKRRRAWLESLKQHYEHDAEDSGSISDINNTTEGTTPDGKVFSIVSTENHSEKLYPNSQSKKGVAKEVLNEDLLEFMNRNPLVPTDSYKDRIVECVMIGDQRRRTSILPIRNSIFEYGDETELSPITQQGTRLFLKISELTTTHRPKDRVVICEKCGTCFRNQVSFVSHARMPECKSKLVDSKAMTVSYYLQARTNPKCAFTVEFPDLKTPRRKKKRTAPENSTNKDKTDDMEIDGTQSDLSGNKSSRSLSEDTPGYPNEHGRKAKFPSRIHQLDFDAEKDENNDGSKQHYDDIAKGQKKNNIHYDSSDCDQNDNTKQYTEKITNSSLTITNAWENSARVENNESSKKMEKTSGIVQDSLNQNNAIGLPTASDSLEPNLTRGNMCLPQPNMTNNNDQTETLGESQQPLPTIPAWDSGRLDLPKQRSKQKKEPVKPPSPEKPPNSFQTQSKPAIVDIMVLAEEVNMGRYPSMKNFHGEHSDRCVICKLEGGIIFCCEFCSKACHLECVRRKIVFKDPEPDDDFMCHNCIQTVLSRRARAEKRRVGKRNQELGRAIQHDGNKVDGVDAPFIRAPRGPSQRCKDCPGCLAKECAKCIYCLDQKKFGGRRLLRRPCVKRRCAKLKYSKDMVHSQNRNPPSAPTRVNESSQESLQTHTLSSYMSCPNGGPGGLVCCAQCAASYCRGLSDTTREMESQSIAMFGREMSEMMELVMDAQVRLRMAIDASDANDRKRDLLDEDEVSSCSSV